MLREQEQQPATKNAQAAPKQQPATTNELAEQEQLYATMNELAEQEQPYVTMNELAAQASLNATVLGCLHVRHQVDHRQHHVLYASQP
jgi:hypothetical protein